MSYTEQYSSFGGADIVVSVGTTVLGTLQSISWSTSRAKAPIHVMNGSPDPLSYGRGIRAIAGVLSFVNFDRDALLGYMETSGVDNPWISKNTNRGSDSNETIGTIGQSTASDSAWAAWVTANNNLSVNNASINQYREQVSPFYADQLLPFDVHISYTNDYGKAAKKSLFGVEIINEGSGISIEDIQLDSQYNFVARSMSKMLAVAP